MGMADDFLASVSQQSGAGTGGYNPVVLDIPGKRDGTATEPRRYRSRIDTSQGDLKTLDQIMGEAANALPEGYRLEAISGYRPGATIDRLGDYYLHHFGGPLLVFCGALAAAVAARSRTVLFVALAAWASRLRYR